MKLPFQRRPARPVPRRRLDAERQKRNDKLDSSTAATSFRRNSTLIGSRSTMFRSASELSRQVALQSPRATVHHLRAYRRRLGLYLLGGLIACLGIYGVLNQLTDQVVVTVYGQVAPLAEADRQRLESTIDSYLDDHPLERLRLFMNKDRLVAYFAAHDMREVSAVTDISRGTLGQTYIRVKVREPVASWTIGDDRRYVDGDGIIFAHNYFAKPSVQIRDESGLGLAGESQATAVTSSRFLRFIGQAVNTMHQYQIAISTVSIPANTTRQVELLVGKSRIKMTIDRSVGEQSEDAARAWKYLQSKQRQVRYIDVRVEGRAYYR